MSAATIGEALRAAAAELTGAGIGTAGLDARVLLADALGRDRAGLIGAGSDRLPEAAAARFADMIRRRRDREPVGRIIGRREFWSRDFVLGPDTLEPRPDSETLVEAALDLLPPDTTARILDLGTGTGCLLISILAERPGASGVGIDIAEGAVAIASINAARLGLADRARFARADFASFRADQPFTMVIANPPYIRTGDLAALEPELVHDPRRALDGGSDGLDAYRVIATRLVDWLDPCGIALLEIGADQAGAVARLCAGAHPSHAATICVRRDFAGHDRVLLLDGAPDGTKPRCKKRLESAR